jgi:hypothetical protein
MYMWKRKCNVTICIFHGKKPISTSKEIPPTRSTSIIQRASQLVEDPGEESRGDCRLIDGEIWYDQSSGRRRELRNIEKSKEILVESDVESAGRRESKC